MKKFLYGILLLIIGALIGYAIELYKSSEQGRIRYIDEEVIISKSVLNLPTLPAQKIEVFLNDAKVEHITEVRVVLSNFEDKDFSDIPVFVSIVPKEGQYVDVIAKDAYVGPTESRDRVSELTNVKAPLKIESKKFGFKIHTLNRTYGYEDKAYFLFYLLGKVDPKIVVGVNKTGVELRPYSYKHYTDIRPVSSYVPMVAAIFFVVFFTAGYFYFFYWFIFKYKKRKRIEMRASDIKFLNELIQAKYPDFSDRELGGRLLYELEKKEYMDLSKIDKLVTNEPKETDFFDVQDRERSIGEAEQDVSADS